jgi:hypothetical protein
MDAQLVWLLFIGRKQEELGKAGVSEEERRLGNRALAEMRVSLRGRSSAELRRKSPEDEYFLRKAAKAQEEREKQARWDAVERKLDEYDVWAQQVRSASGPRFRRVGREYLLTESYLREKSLEVLAAAVLGEGSRYGLQLHRPEAERGREEAGTAVRDAALHLVTSAECGRGDAGACGGADGA